MGLKIGFSNNSSNEYDSPAIGFSRSCEEKYGKVDGVEDLFLEPPKRDGNPNKYRYTLVRTLRIGNVLVVHLHYPDCYNYKGNKVCVYDDAGKFLEIHHQERCVDPHFLETSYSPVARFEPTARGWDLAVNFAKMLKGDITGELQNG